MCEADVDVVALDQWMDDAGLAPGRARIVRRLAGGTQNLLLEIERGGCSFVLRRPSSSAGERGEGAIRREVTVLAALEGTAVPHPRLIASCLDPTVLGASFYVMETVHGFNITVELPDFVRSSCHAREELTASIIEALAGLMDVDISREGLAQLGRLDGYLERQVPRWRAQLDLYRQYEGYETSSLAAAASIGDWLDRNRPTTFSPGLVHGDFHLANLLFDPHDARLATVLDWELANLGDPLADLALLLATWPDVSNPAAGVFDLDPTLLPPSSRLVELYTARCSHDLENLGWFEVLACYRMAIIIEGSHARARVGLADVDIGEHLHANAVLLLERADMCIGR